MNRMDKSDTPYLDPQQILGAFDEHMEKFKWRIADIVDKVESVAYRQQIAQVVSEVNQLRHINARLEHVFKSIGIDPREHRAWAEKRDG